MSTTKETGEQQSAEVRWANSQRVYVEGEAAGVRVPLREVALNATRRMDGRVEEDPPVRVYDTAGPSGDPSVQCDERVGLAALRREWIVARADVEEYVGREVKPEDDGYLTAGAAEYAQAKTKGRLEYFPGLRRAPLRAPAAHRGKQMHYSRRGLATPEMELIALRETRGPAMAFNPMTPTER